MEIDTTTIIFEIVNFLVLVWLLKRVLFGPLQQVLQQRQQNLQRATDTINSEREEVERQSARLAQERQELEQLKTQACKDVAREIAEIRENKLVALEAEMERYKADHLSRLAQSELQLRRKLESDVLDEMFVFVSKLLERLAGSELDELLFRLLISDLRKAQFPGMSKAINLLDCDKLIVYTAHALKPEVGDLITTELKKVVSSLKQLEFLVDPSLIAGVKIINHNYEIAADLGDELSFFKEGIVSVARE